MRCALLILIGCASHPQQRLDVLDEPAPPAATFRWSLEPIPCDDEAPRSTADQCFARDGIGGEGDHVLAVYPPIAGESAVTVLRYDGAHAGAPLRWQRDVALGADPHDAVIVIAREAAIVAAISDGACRVVAIDKASGRLLGTQTIVEHGARAVQLEGIADHARIHVRTRDGGVVAVMNPRTARVLAHRHVDDRAIVDGEVVRAAPVPEPVGDLAVTWDALRLVVRRVGVWRQVLRIAATEVDRPLHRASLLRAGDRVIVTIHDPEEARVEVRAFDRASGRPLWRSPVTGSAPRAFDQGIVRAHLDTDQVIVSSSGGFTCSVGLADGVERACVDRLLPRLESTVIDFSDDAIVTP